MNSDTIEAALNDLDIAYERIWCRRVGEQRNTQSARYNGMKSMFELLTGKKIDISREGKHRIHDYENQIA